MLMDLSEVLSTQSHFTNLVVFDRFVGQRGGIGKTPHHPQTAMTELELLSALCLSHDTFRGMHQNGIHLIIVSINASSGTFTSSHSLSQLPLSLSLHFNHESFLSLLSPSASPLRLSSPPHFLLSSAILHDSTLTNSPITQPHTYNTPDTQQLLLNHSSHTKQASCHTSQLSLRFELSRTNCRSYPPTDLSLQIHLHDNRFQTTP